jgi:hypothetical protein
VAYQLLARNDDLTTRWTLQTLFMTPTRLNYFNALMDKQKKPITQYTAHKQNKTKKKKKQKRKMTTLSLSLSVCLIAWIDKKESMPESIQNRPHLLSHHHCSSISFCQLLLVPAINAFAEICRSCSVLWLNAPTKQKTSQSQAKIMSTSNVQKDGEFRTCTRWISYLYHHPHLFSTPPRKEKKKKREREFMIMS